MNVTNLWIMPATIPEGRKREGKAINHSQTLYSADGNIAEIRKLFAIFASMGKANYDITKQMRADMIKAYCKACEGSWTMQEACAKAVLMPAPRFYITPKQAYNVISTMVKGDFEMVDLYPPLKRKMYYELFDVVMRLTEKREFIGKSLWYIMPFAVIQPASQFFYKPHSLYCIRQEMKNYAGGEEGCLRSHKRKKKK